MNVLLEWFVRGRSSDEGLSDADVERIMQLLKQLSPARQFADENFRSLIDNVRLHSHLLIARTDDGSIVGMGTLVPIHKLTGFEGHVEDVVVHDSCRGEGLGRTLMQELLRSARAFGMKRLTLTSDPEKPERTSARVLYAKLGFTERGGLFVLPLVET